MYYFIEELKRPLLELLFPDVLIHRQLRFTININYLLTGYRIHLVIRVPLL